MAVSAENLAAMYNNLATGVSGFPEETIHIGGSRGTQTSMPGGPSSLATWCVGVGGMGLWRVVAGNHVALAVCRVVPSCGVKVHDVWALC